MSISGETIQPINVDVFVAGGGTAGCMAAIAAARTGAKVVLVEKLPVPGGTLANGGIGVSSFYSQNVDPDKASRIVGGLPYEMISRLIDAGGATSFARTPDNPQRNAYRVVADHEAYKAVICKMLIEAGVKVLLNTLVTEVETDGNDIKCVHIQNRSGHSIYVAKSYIDATGDGDLAKRFGVEQLDMTQGKECPTGMVFGISGIDWDRVLKENGRIFHALCDENANEHGVVCKNYIFAPGYAPQKYGMMKSLEGIKIMSFQVNHPGEATYVNLPKGEMVDGTDVEALSAAEMRMRVRIFDIVNDLKKYVPGFENAYLSWASIQLGVRISYINKCDHSISQEEIEAGKRFEDEIGLYGFHDLAVKDGENAGIGGDGYYGFPYRMILPQGCDNLYVVGRSVTEEYAAHMSTRNTVGCMIMGQAAGVAASLCARDDCKTRQLAYPVLREELLKQEVILNV